MIWKCLYFFSSFLKGIFAKYRILGWQVFFPQHLKSIALLTSDEKPVVKLFSLVCNFHLWLLSSFLLIVIFLLFDYNVTGGVFLVFILFVICWASWICKYMCFFFFFTKFGKFWSYFFKFISVSFYVFYFSGTPIMHVCVIDRAPQISEALFIFLHYFHSFIFLFLRLDNLNWYIF